MKLPPPLPSGAATMTDVQAVAIAGRSSRRGRRGEEAIATTEDIKREDGIGEVIHSGQDGDQVGHLEGLDDGSVEHADDDEDDFATLTGA